MIITTAKAVGVEHEKFQQTFAYQCTLLDLEPKVCKEFRWPGHLLRLKSRSEIRSIADIDSFFQHCSVDALMQQCDDEGQVEEQMLLALPERIATCLKAPHLTGGDARASESLQLQAAVRFHREHN